MSKATEEKIFEQIAQHGKEYKLRRFGRTDVDMYGRPTLKKEDIAFIRKTEKTKPMSMKEAIAPLYFDDVMPVLKEYIK